MARLQSCPAIQNWVREHVTFVSNSTDSSTSAVDTLIEQVGVCRDFAHLMIALCRALSIPARFVTGTDYGADPALGPPDFHAYVEVYLNDRWYLFDPSAQLSDGTGTIRYWSRCGRCRLCHYLRYRDQFSPSHRHAGNHRPLPCPLDALSLPPSPIDSITKADFSEIGRAFDDAEAIMNRMTTSSACHQGLAITTLVDFGEVDVHDFSEIGRAFDDAEAIMNRMTTSSAYHQGLAITTLVDFGEVDVHDFSEIAARLTLPKRL